MDSCFKQTEFFIFWSTHIPASTTEEVLIPYPKCGEEKDIKQWNLSLYSRRLGRAALMFTPPKLCPIKDIFESVFMGKFYTIKLFTYAANRSPISRMFVSVWSSLEVAHRNMDSGYINDT